MFKDDDDMDMEEFKRNLSKEPMGEYEQDELMESCRKNFPEKIRSKEAQKIYNESINEPGSKKIFKMITDFKYAFADEKTDAEEDVMMRIASHLGMNLNEMLFERMVNDQLNCKDGINSALIMSLAVANKGKCKDPELQRYLIGRFPKIKRYFGACGELAFMAFCSQLMMYEHFVDEMIFKEKVYTEIAQIEREPITEKK
jgi:hypothetical protein